jgi:hypothetical protein
MTHTNSKIPDDNGVDFMDDFSGIMKILEKNTKQRETISLKELLEFAPIFRELEEDCSPDEIEYRTNLANKYFQRVNRYSPIEVTGINGEVLFTLPPSQRTLNLLENTQIVSEISGNWEKFAPHQQKMALKILENNIFHSQKLEVSEVTTLRTIIHQMDIHVLYHTNPEFKAMVDAQIEISEIEELPDNESLTYGSDMPDYDIYDDQLEDE